MLTIDALRKCGYTGKIYIIIDNEDKMQDEYMTRFGKENVIVFDKLAKSKECDTCDNLHERNIVLFARNSCHDIAEKLGLTYFLELDDDYVNFRSRMLDEDGKFISVYIRDLDAIFEKFLDFLDLTGAHAVAFAQTGDFIGGATSKVFKDKIARKVMNSFFCRTDRPFQFMGRINEDVNMYVSLGGKGYLFFTIAQVSLDQQVTQKHHGGLTDSYLELGTYVKSFYTVLNCPSCVRVHIVGNRHPRMHHLIDWEKAVPKIISSKYKKY